MALSLFLLGVLSLLLQSLTLPGVEGAGLKFWKKFLEEKPAPEAPAAPSHTSEENDGGPTAVRGVSGKFREVYETALSTGKFNCFDGSKELLFARVNDEYCDCADGSDEPGTSACTYDTRTIITMFRCNYSGPVTKRVPHSRVNDKICDCCDGSDEYLGLVSCRDTCSDDLEREVREAQEREERRLQGIKNKETMIANGRSKIEEMEKQLAAKREELALQETEIEAIEAEKERTEALEKEEREKIKAKSLSEKEKWEAEREVRRKEKEAEREAHPETEIPPQGDVRSSEVHCIGWRQTKECRSDGPRDESQDKGCDERIPDGWSGFCECMDVLRGAEVKFEKNCGHASLTCDFVCSHNGEEGLPGEAAAEDEEPEEQFKVDDGSSFSLPEAADARSKRLNAVTKKEEIKKEVEKLEGYISGVVPAGPAWVALIDQCFEKAEGSYNYKVCFYTETSQKERSGHKNVVMGKWKGFAESTYSYWGSSKDTSKLKFENGEHCWGGPSRSTTVSVVCGEENRLLSVEEPSSCTYQMTFATPAQCE